MTFDNSLKLYKKLFDGLREEDLTHLKDISKYNRNFYSINGELLFGESDDDNYTQWYWVQGDKSIPVGGSYCSDGDKIIVDGAYL